MTNIELIAKIKAEIERRIKAKADLLLLAKVNSIPTHGDMSIKHYATLGGMASLQNLLFFLSTLESEKPMNQDGLDEEIDRFEDWMETYNQSDYPTSFTKRDIARHFAQWGAEHAREQMMKEAMEGEVIVPIYGGDDTWSAEIKLPGRYEIGDKVRIIIVKED